jgi:hypothetical protein
MKKDPLTTLQREAVYALQPNTRFACKRLAHKARRVIRKLVLAR